MRLPLLLCALCSQLKSQHIVDFSSLDPSRPSSFPTFPVHRLDGDTRSFLRLSHRNHFRSHGRVPKDEVQELLSRSLSQGFVASSICEYRYNDSSLFVVNLERGEGLQTVLLSLSLEELQRAMSKMTERRAKPVHISVSPWGSFSAIWLESHTFLRHFIVQEGSFDEILEADLLHSTHNYFPDSLHVFSSSNNSLNALVIWRKGFGNRYRIQWGKNVTRLREEMKNSDLKLHTASAVDEDGEETVFLVWKGDEFSWQGRELPVSRATNESLAFVDEQVEAIMRARRLPALSVGVLHDDLDLYLAAFGFSDLRQRDRATPNSVFRVASVSKVVTAMCVCRLVSWGRLSLQSRVFGPGGVLSSLLPSLSLRSPLRFVTVDHLLTHSTGAWSHLAQIEFLKKELEQTEFLKWALSSFPPRFLPGYSHVYSNIGFILVGRVIESVSNRSYEEFAKDEVFRPMNISAAVASDERREGEVRYYSHDNANPYLHWDPRRLDAAAGWTLRAVDVARLLQHVHNDAVYRPMLWPSSSNWNYGRGLQLGADGSVFHVGSIAGVEAVGYSRGKVSVGVIANVRGAAENEVTAWMLSLARLVSQRLPSNIPNLRRGKGRRK